MSNGGFSDTATLRKWLARANARTVWYAALVALFLQVAWWIWREWRGTGSEPKVPPSRVRAEEIEGLGLLALLDDAAGAPTGSGNPFQNLRPPRPPPPAVAPPVPRPSPPPPPPPPAPPQPPLPPRERVRLLYRGMFEGSHAELRALIEDSKRRRAAFYRVGDVLFGMRVQDIRMLEVLLRPVDGDEVILKLGEPYEFDEQPRGY